jgi:hypothetical protein
MSNRKTPRAAATAQALSTTELVAQVVNLGTAAGVLLIRIKEALGVSLDAPLPSYGDLQSYLTAHPSPSGVLFDDIRRAFADEWDRLYVGKGDTYAAKPGVRHLALLSCKDAGTWHRMSKEERTAHNAGDDTRINAAKEVIAVVSRFASGKWAQLLAADRAMLGETTGRGASEKKSIEEQLRTTPVERLPHKVAKLKTDGYEVAAFWADLSKAIIDNKRLYIKPEKNKG